MIKHYRLEGREVVECSLMEWAAWFETASKEDGRRVASDHVAGYWVSTVFLGLDHSPYGQPRELFETAVFNGDDADCEIMGRAAHWDEAQDMHDTVCASLRLLESEAIDVTRAAIATIRAGLHKE